MRQGGKSKTEQHSQQNKQVHHGKNGKKNQHKKITQRYQQNKTYTHPVVDMLYSKAFEKRMNGVAVAQSP